MAFEIIESCTIITTDAAPGIDRLHNRMPVMLRERDFARWLDVETPLGEDYVMSRLDTGTLPVPASAGGERIAAHFAVVSVQDGKVAWTSAVESLPAGSGP